MGACVFLGMAGQVNGYSNKRPGGRSHQASPPSFICPAMPEKTLRHESLGKEDEM